MWDASLDLLSEVKGLGSYKDVNASAITAELFGRSVRTLDLKSLIASKRAAGRTKDIAVVMELEGLLD
ncbi:MAG: hypothetical protein LAO79_29795 [Acidobacteriia bacterium]|nr:hypothetical protein [Terriglobia bacterium]